MIRARALGQPDRKRASPTAMCVAAMVLVACGGAGAQSPRALPPTLAPAAALYGALGPRELDAVAHGRAAVTALRTDDRDEIALVGLVTVAVPPTFYASHAGGARDAVDSATGRASGIVRQPAAPADFAGLRLRDDDARALASCRPMHCALKLPAETMASISRRLAAAPVAPDSLLHEWLAARVEDYRVRGDSALPVYDDTRRGERSADGFAALLAEDAALLRDAPGLAAYLTGPPADTVPGVQSVLFWTTEHAEGAAPIASVMQRSIYTPPGADAPTIVATKQLWASHYFDARLDVVVLAPASAEPEPLTYVLVVRRLRFDKLSGGGLFDIRGRVLRKVRSALADQLTHAKALVEREYRASAAR